MDRIQAKLDFATGDAQADLRKLLARSKRCRPTAEAVNSAAEAGDRVCAPISGDFLAYQSAPAGSTGAAKLARAKTMVPSCVKLADKVKKQAEGLQALIDDIIAAEARLHTTTLP